MKATLHESREFRKTQQSEKVATKLSSEINAFEGEVIDKDGGWSEAFAALPESKRYELPVKTEDEECFNLVFQPTKAGR